MGAHRVQGHHKVKAHGCYIHAEARSQSVQALSDAQSLGAGARPPADKGGGAWHASRVPLACGCRQLLPSCVALGQWPVHQLSSCHYLNPNQ